MKKILKILGIVLGIGVGVFIIGFILTVVFTLNGIGNPVKNVTAKKNIEEYIETAYPDNDFEDVKVTYNFKFGGYSSTIQSKGSVDTMFYVTYDEGEIYDSYDEYVTGGLNTYRRIIDEYNDYVDAMFLNEYGNGVELCLYDIYSYKSKDDGVNIITQVVPLDGELDIHEVDGLGLEPNITVWFVSEEISYDIMAEKFIETKAFMEENNVYASVYSLRLKLPEDHPDRFDIGIHVYDFPVELIGSDEMMEKIIEFDEKGKEIPEAKEVG